MQFQCVSSIDALSILCCVLAMLIFFVDILFRLYCLYHLSSACCYCNYHYQVVTKSPQRRSSLESADNAVPNKCGLINSKSANECDEDKTEYDIIGADVSINQTLPDVAANNVELPNLVTVSEGAFFDCYMILFYFSFGFFIFYFLLRVQ